MKRLESVKLVQFLLYEQQEFRLDEITGLFGRKAIGVDRKSVFLGSMNLDPRSKRLNTEVALQVESADFGQELGSMFDEATAPDRVFRVELDEPRNAAAALHWESLEDGGPVRYTGEPLASMWRRIFTPIISALTPEELL